MTCRALFHYSLIRYGEKGAIIYTPRQLIWRTYHMADNSNGEKLRHICAVMLITVRPVRLEEQGLA